MSAFLSGRLFVSAPADADCGQNMSPYRLFIVVIAAPRFVPPACVWPGGYVSFGRCAPYPLTDPSAMPVTKYFCRKGYTTRIGTAETTEIAARTVTGATLEVFTS